MMIEIQFYVRRKFKITLYMTTWQQSMTVWWNEMCLLWIFIPYKKAAENIERSEGHYWSHKSIESLQNDGQETQNTSFFLLNSFNTEFLRLFFTSKKSMLEKNFWSFSIKLPLHHHWIFLHVFFDRFHLTFHSLTGQHNKKHEEIF